MTDTITWQDLWKMTEPERQAHMARDRERMASGDMTSDEAKALSKAWRDYAAHHEADLKLMNEIARLARATGCPKGEPMIPWLIKRGLVMDMQGRVPLPSREIDLGNGKVLVEELDRYRLTDKAKGLRAVAS